MDVDLQGWRPTKGQLDKRGNEIVDRIYNQKDFDRTLVIDRAYSIGCPDLTNYLKKTDPMAKTIVFAKRHRSCRTDAPRPGQPQPGSDC